MIFMSDGMHLCWQIERLEQLVLESQQGVDSAARRTHSLKQTVNSLNTELDAVRSQLSSINSRHISLQVGVYLCIKACTF